MSSRRHDYSKGSSSSRDDSRRHKERDHGRRRSRSRSPRRHSPDERNSYKNEEYQPKRKWSGDSPREGEEVPAPPPPPRITKISIGFNKPKQAPIKIKLGEGSKVTPSGPIKKASVFDDDDDEPEEMPAEARMRMRNIGRETPTSAGPNSFGKTKQGFCDAKKVFEKNLKEALETAERTPAGTFKLPQTIYKIQP